MKLCLNPYSPNWQKLRDSPYANQIQTGLIDPHAEEIAGKAYVVDTDIDRNDQAALFSYLQKKYKTGRLMNMDMNMVSVEVVIPKNVQLVGALFQDPILHYHTIFAQHVGRMSRALSALQKLYRHSHAGGSPF